MKKIILTLLFFCTLISANEQRLVISGITIHETKKDDSGYLLNENNYGIGYEYNTFNNFNQLYFTSNFLVLKDSYNETQYSAAFSPNIRFRLNSSFSTSIGASIFLLYKKACFSDLCRLNNDATYSFIPGVAPTTSLFYKDISINVAYVPSFSHNEILVIGFTYFYFTWKFK